MNLGSYCVRKESRRWSALDRGTSGETRKLFNQPLLMLEDLRHRDQEARFHALGKTLDGRALHITFTLRGDGTLIRVISARDMH